MTEKRKCECCGYMSSSCVMELDDVEREMYCVCPACYAWSNHSKAELPRTRTSIRLTKEKAAGRKAKGKNGQAAGRRNHADNHHYNLLRGCHAHYVAGRR